MSEIDKDKYRSEFVENVSHELKTPLTAIRNYVETLLDGAIDDKENNIKFLKKIKEHAISLQDLIDDIIEVSKLESGSATEAFVVVDLCQVVSLAVETLTNKAKKKGVLLVKEKPKVEKIVIKGNEELIGRAILNLLDNAINYTNEWGGVTVSCEQNDHEIKILVKDTGIGIAKEHLTRIFERFFRVDKARSRLYGGTGLGLAIVKHAMNLHQGRVEVVSEEGKGSTFALVFPA
ncbi:MAG: ATP-binding protein [bacterium]|nr:ATP-binding protein [Candidatus Margulisiibacteriota bacterium]